MYAEPLENSISIDLLQSDFIVMNCVEFLVAIDGLLYAEPLENSMPIDLLQSDCVVMNCAEFLVPIDGFQNDYLLECPTVVDL